MASPTRSNHTPNSTSAAELSSGTGLNAQGALSAASNLGAVPDVDSAVTGVGSVGVDSAKPVRPASGSGPAEGGRSTETDRVSTLEQNVGFDHLLELFQEVIAARAALTVARRAPLGRSRLVDAPRARLLVALEAYTAELNSRNLPVPYSIRDDLRIQRRILGRAAGTTG